MGDGEFEAKNEAIQILIERHKDEFYGIYKRKLVEIAKYGGILI